MALFFNKKLLPTFLSKREGGCYDLSQLPVGHASARWKAANEKWLKPWNFERRTLLNQTTRSLLQSFYLQDRLSIAFKFRKGGSEASKRNSSSSPLDLPQDASRNSFYSAESSWRLVSFCLFDSSFRNDFHPRSGSFRSTSHSSFGPYSLLSLHCCWKIEEEAGKEVTAWS